jgi:hypothetical protein
MARVPLMREVQVFQLHYPPHLSTSFGADSSLAATVASPTMRAAAVSHHDAIERHMQADRTRGIGRTGRGKPQIVAIHRTAILSSMRR